MGRALVLTLLLLAGCAAPRTFNPPEVSYADREPIVFGVSAVDVVNRHSPDSPRSVEDRLPLSPAEAATRLLRQRLQAAGGPGSVRAVVVDGSVVQEELPTTGGLLGLLRTEPEVRYNGRLEAAVQIIGPAGEERAGTSVAVTRARTAPEGSGFSERQRIAFELVRQLTDDLDRELASAVRNNLGAFLVAAPAQQGGAVPLTPGLTPGPPAQPDQPAVRVEPL